MENATGSVATCELGGLRGGRAQRRLDVFRQLRGGRCRRRNRRGACAGAGGGAAAGLCAGRRCRLPPRLDDQGLADDAGMREALDFHLVPGDCHIHEAVLVVVTVDAGQALGGDTAAAAGDHPSRIADGGVPGRHFLLVSMAGDEEVDAVGLGKPRPSVLLELWREMSHDHEPIRIGGAHALLHPGHLFQPKLCKPVKAMGRRSRARSTAGRTGGIVERRADVVVRLFVGREGVVDIAVHEVVVHREVTVLHLGAPIQSGRQPSVAAAPGVCDGLVPSFCELVAAIIVVAQDTHPRFPRKVRTIVDLLEDSIPLSDRALFHAATSTALRIDTTPIEVVPDVEQIPRLTHSSSLLHLRGDKQLGTVIYILYEGPRAMLVVEGRDGRHVLAPEDATPIADDEEVFLNITRLEAEIWPGDAVVVRGPLRRLRPLCSWRAAECTIAAGLCERMLPNSRQEAGSGDGRGAHQC
mmetsp:Transcript_18104/g.47561  ORF Transcript_18104/g.47561 Transcript_18104/m.47561 type:complete len:468 (+) Transcript_18104:385-1788(+)